ncbi:MAG: hypothetical protein J6M31_05080 [Bacteroidales bacterium]|nr:hypothetical protein [Bacteroidales bacterium]
MKKEKYLQPLSEELMLHAEQMICASGLNAGDGGIEGWTEDGPGSWNAPGLPEFPGIPGLF